MYSQLFRDQARLLKVLAQPKRLEIIHLLRHQQLMVTEMYTMLDLPQANVSQHLMVLRKAGVVKTKRKGKEIYYSLVDEQIIEASDQLRAWLMTQHAKTKGQSEQGYSLQELLPVVADPVCGMQVSPKTAGFVHTHQAETYYFCASGCLKAFTKNPEKYVRKN